MAPSSCDWVSSTARISFIWLFFFFPPLIYQISLALYIPFRSHSYVHISSVSLADFFFTFFSFSISHRSPRPLPCKRLLLASQLFAWLLCAFFFVNCDIASSSMAMAKKKSKQRREKASTRERRNIKRSGAEKRDVEKESQRRSFVIESILCIESSSSRIIGGIKGA